MARTKQTARKSTCGGKAPKRQILSNPEQEEDSDADNEEKYELDEDYGKDEIKDLPLSKKPKLSLPPPEFEEKQNVAELLHKYRPDLELTFSIDENELHVCSTLIPKKDLPSCQEMNDELKPEDKMESTSETAAASSAEVKREVDEPVTVKGLSNVKERAQSNCCHLIFMLLYPDSYMPLPEQLGNAEMSHDFLELKSIVEQPKQPPPLMSLQWTVGVTQQANPPVNLTISEPAKLIEGGQQQPKPPANLPTSPPPVTQPPVAQPVQQQQQNVNNNNVQRDSAFKVQQQQQQPSAPPSIIANKNNTNDPRQGAQVQPPGPSVIAGNKPPQPNKQPQQQPPQQQQPSKQPLGSKDVNLSAEIAKRRDETVRKYRESQLEREKSELQKRLDVVRKDKMDKYKRPTHALSFINGPLAATLEQITSTVAATDPNKAYMFRIRNPDTQNVIDGYGKTVDQARLNTAKKALQDYYNFNWDEYQKTAPQH